VKVQSKKSASSASKVKVQSKKSASSASKVKVQSKKSAYSASKVKVQDSTKKPKTTETKTKAEAATKPEVDSPDKPRGRQYFLMKSEPDSRFENGMDMKFSFDDLKESPNQTAEWDGVRNYQARNIMRSMRVGDVALFYHSNCKPPGIVGVCTIVREAYPDHTQFDPKNPHYAPKSTKESPIWDMVDVKFERQLRRYIPLDELKTHAGDGLAGMALLSRGRLSVSPVSEAHYRFIMGLEDAEQ
jgi:predicted RNA-binding protein with PUA-like domain